jgi:hypothetical protein
MVECAIFRMPLRRGFLGGLVMKTPIHFWIVSVVSLLWNLMGTVDYTMTQTKNSAYLAQFTPEQLAYFASFPAWAVGFWATAVWFALLGSVLLLLRQRAAFPVFFVSFCAMLVTMVQNYFFSSVPLSDVSGPGAIWFSLAICLIAFGLVVYSRRMIRSGVLR